MQKLNCYIKWIPLFILFSFNSIAQTYIGNYTGHSVDGRRIKVIANSAMIIFTFYRSDVLRVDFLPTLSSASDSSFTVIRDTTNSIPFSLEESDSTFEIISSKIKVVCKKYPLRVSYYNAASEKILEEPVEGGFAVSSEERIVNFVSKPNDHFYGTGERGTSLDKKGQKFLSYNTTVFGYSNPEPVMNINVPLITTAQGYALFIDNTYKDFYDFGFSNNNRFSYSVSGGELTYYLIVGATVPEQLEAFTWLTGSQPLPPLWSLGYLQSKYGYRNQSEANSFVQTIRQKQIPCDAIILDLYWYNQMGDMQWNNSNWSTHQQMIDGFLTIGIKTVLIVQPYVTQSSSNYPTALNSGYFAVNYLGNPYTLSNWWSCNCNAGLLDLTKSNVRNWLGEKYTNLFNQNVAGLWTDLGEPERHPDDMIHNLGSAQKVHNIYNLLWAETIFEKFNSIRPNERLFNLTRSGFAGIQRFGVFPWSGDVSSNFQGLQVQLPMMLNMGMSGLAYHHSDLGGFCCSTTSAELYIRWMQHGAFSPVMRAHGVDNQAQEPWGYGVFAEEVVTKFIRERYKLLPYLYSAAYENFKAGIPIVRPLFFEYPEENFYNTSSEYMLGSSMLVSPVVNEGVTDKNIYLPQGEWIYYWNDKVYNGGKSIFINTPLNEMPVFLKAGSVIPKQPVKNYVDESLNDTLIFAVYSSLTSDGSFTLYEDDGKTLDYTRAYYSLTSLYQYTIGSDTAATVNLMINEVQGTYQGKQQHRIYLSEFHCVREMPESVNLNSSLLPMKNSYSDLRTSLYGFYFDENKKILYTQTKADADSAYLITLNNASLITSTTETNTVPISDYKLSQNYPNPFNSSTLINYYIIERGRVVIRLYDVLGREVMMLYNSEDLAGSHTLSFNSNNLSSGIYFYSLSVNGVTRGVRKMVMIK
ncbi:MAG: DUF5110 domain-containing protein [Ignavibacteriaceae bacterium]|nr:DUF5110 domain-containing protein [Ignavibacteriaceae bacterium]